MAIVGKIHARAKYTHARNFGETVATRGECKKFLAPPRDMSPLGRRFSRVCVRACVRVFRPNRQKLATSCSPVPSGTYSGCVVSLILKKHTLTRTHTHAHTHTRTLLRADYVTVDSKERKKKTQNRTIKFLLRSSQASEKPSQSTKQTSEPPTKKRKRKDKKPPGKVKGALSLLIQYDSDSQSSCGTHGTESDDSSAHSTSPVSGTLSPVVTETTDPPRYQTSGVLPEQSHEISANKCAQINGTAASLKSGDKITEKKRPSNGKTPVEKKKKKSKGRGEATPISPFVNLNDTVVSMQQLKSGSPSVSMPGSYQPYPSAYASYPPTGQHGYVMPGYSVPTNALNFAPGGHPHAQYATSLPQYYPGEGHPAAPGYSTSPGGYFPQWRTSYAPMQCQPPRFNYTKNGSNGSNVYR